MNLCKFEGKVVKEPYNLSKINDSYIIRFKIVIKGESEKFGEKITRFDYIDLVAFDEIGKLIIEEYKKNDIISVDCKVQNRVYTNKKNEKIKVMILSLLL